MLSHCVTGPNGGKRLDCGLVG